MIISWITIAGVMNLANGEPTSPVASIRYRVLSRIGPAGARLHTHQIFNARGALEPDRRAKALAGEVMVFSKSLALENESLAREAIARGIPVIWDVCDNHYEHPTFGNHYKDMTALATKVVCSTPEMAEVAKRYSRQPPVVLEDPYEGPRGAPAFAPDQRLKLLWYGSETNLDSLASVMSDLATYSETQPISLTVLTEVSAKLEAYCADVTRQTGGALTMTPQAWSLEDQWRALAECDAVILPSLDNPAKTVKSANRMVEALWAGRAVVAHPVPSYMPFAAWTPIGSDLIEGLKALLADRENVAAKVAAAQAYIEPNFDPAAIAARWETLLKELPKPSPAAAVPPPAVPVRLNLGCGDKILPGYVNVDVAESRLGKRPDVLCDLRALTPFGDNSADEIMSIHVVEHFWRWEVVDILKEWVRVLKPGGKMILECPNLISAAQTLLADPDQASLPGKEGQRSMWVFYGDPQWQDPLMVHRWGYTPRSLGQIMQEAGLTELRQEPAQFKLREPRDMRITGVKPS